MSDYTATATREGKWWVIEVPGVGVTQSRTLADAQRWADDLVEAMTGETHANVRVQPNVKGVHLELALEAKRRLSAAEKELRDASGEIRTVVRELQDAGVTQQDAATALGVSRQRIQQLGGKRSYTS